MMQSTKAFVAVNIKTRPDYYKSENVETGLTPEFIVYVSKGNDKETLNMYIDYKTSKRFINRSILALGSYDNFTRDNQSELIQVAINELAKLGIKAKSNRDSYQGEGKV